MSFQVTRVPADRIPVARSMLGERWHGLMEALLSAHESNEGIRVTPMTLNEAGNFRAAMKKRGIRMIQRRETPGADVFVFRVVSIEPKP
jgi:hypothetical protein